jgi:phosphoglycolate phosphatase-like HAD superfamily hydrolase
VSLLCYRLSPLLHRHSLPNSLNKPDPRVAQHVLRQWGLVGQSSVPAAADAAAAVVANAVGGAESVWFVGDSLDDMACGRGAGCKTCLIRTPHNEGLVQSRPELIDLMVDSLTEFGEHIGLR